MTQATLYLLLEVADELTEPHPHVERIPYWDAHRNKKHREHRTTQPGLLAQLYDAAVDPVKVQQEGGGRVKQKSRPPLAIEAFSRYDDICAGALRWVTSIRLAARDTAESNIRALVGAAPRFDLDTLDALYQEMKTWRRWAAVMTGWQTQVFRPRIACPVCCTRGSIFVNGTEQLAYCGECQHSWEGEDLVDMAERVRMAA
jgi:hypothetical protein